jgi:hypothetical protein
MELVELARGLVSPGQDIFRWISPSCLLLSLFIRRPTYRVSERLRKAPDIQDAAGTTVTDDLELKKCAFYFSDFPTFIHILCGLFLLSKCPST